MIKFHMKNKKWKIIVAILNFFFGVFLVITGLIEVLPPFLEDIKALNLRSHHGVTIIGLWHVLIAVLDISEGVKHIQEIRSHRVSEAEEEE